MKNPIMLSLFLFSITGMGFAQEPKSQCLPLIGDFAPSFTAESTQGSITFPEGFGRKWKILFSHPADFTPVCSSEIIELAAAQSEFDALGVQLAVISTDALDKHYTWEKSLETVRYQGQDPVKINFPLISDEKRVIARSYGMLQPESQFLNNVRGVFIINPDNKIEAIFIYPMNVGRNIEEIRRTVAALQTASTHTVLTPANWKPGDDVLLPYLQCPDEAAVKSETDDPGTYTLTWYMLFKKLTSQDE